MDRTSLVRIHSSCVKTEEDAIQLNKIQSKYEANYNTQTSCSMWFDFKSIKDACGFVKSISEKIPYLKLTLWFRKKPSEN